MSKGRLPAILLNTDFYSKGRNIRWMKENGYESIPILQAVWIASSQEKDCKISKDDAYSVPFLLTFDFEKINKILDSAVEVGLLDGNETHYWNSQIVKDAKKFQSKHNNYSRASKEREKAKQEQDSAKILPESGQNHIDTDTEYVTDNDTDINLKELDTSEIKLWLAKTRARIKASGGTTDQLWVDALLMKYAGRPTDLLAALKHSATLTKTRNVYEPKSEARDAPKSSINSNAQKALDLAKKYEEEGV